jgi:hypothetical protein
MWPEIVEALPPIFDLGMGVFEGQEPMHVQTFTSETAVERFDERLVSRLAWP